MCNWICNVAVICIIFAIKGKAEVVKVVNDAIEQQIESSDRTKQEDSIGIGTATIAVLLTKARIDSEIENSNRLHDDNNNQHSSYAVEEESESIVGHNEHDNVKSASKSGFISDNEETVPIHTKPVHNNSINNLDTKRVWGSSDHESSDTREDVDLSQIVQDIDTIITESSEAKAENEYQQQELKRVWGSDHIDDKQESSIAAPESLHDTDLPILETKRAWGTAEPDGGTIQVDPLLNRELIVEPNDTDTVPFVDTESNSQHPEAGRSTIPGLDSEPQIDRDEAKRMWGSASEAHHILDSTTGSLPKVNISKEFGTGRVHSQINSSTVATSDVGKSEQDEVHNVKSTPVPHIPFFSQTNTNTGVRHIPPEGFSFAARVYLSPADALAHFDFAESEQTDEKDQQNIDQQPKPSLKQMLQEITLPYWDCGVIGSTTSPLRVKEAYFRSAMGSSTSWNNADNAVHPVIAIALTPCRLELNSEEAIDVMAGDVILLEDSLRPGHRFVPLGLQKTKSTSYEAHGTPEIKLLFLTLPQHHHHAGKQYISLKDIMQARRTHPCPASFDVSNSASELHTDAHKLSEYTRKKLDIDTLGQNIRNIIPTAINSLRKEDYWDGRKLRLLALGTIGMSLSTLAADFIGRTAPLWLAVGIGGTFFVGFGTYGFAVIADHLLSEAQLWQERRKLIMHQHVSHMNKTSQNES